MAQLWGVNTTNENKPNWLTDAQKENCFATPAGWVLRHNNGIEELLVAVAGLSLAGKLAAATITDIRWGTGTYTAGTTKSVRVQFNEKVTVTGSPTLVVTGSVTGAVTATYASTNTAGDTLVFNFTVPAAGQTLSVGAQSIALAGGTITETGVTPTVNAQLVIGAEDVAKTGTKTTV